MILKEEKGSEIRMRCIAAGALAALAVSLLFLLAAGYFAVPGADDYRYGRQTHAAWETQRTVFAVIAAAGEETAETYLDWQGSYAAIFLMSLHSGIFGVEWYCIGIWILILFFCIGEAVFAWDLLLCVFRTKRETACLGAATLCLASIWFVPSPVEAFYWYNGGIYYSFFFALSCFAGALLIRRFCVGVRKRDGILLFLFAILIGGGNLVTGLLCCCFSLCMVLAMLIRKRVDRTVILSIAVLLAAYLINVFAPGNTVRQMENTLRSAPGGMAAVWSGIRDAASFSFQWMRNPGPWLILAAIPWLKGTDHRPISGLIFLGCILASFLAIAAGFTPSEYALSIPGEARLIDIQYDLFLVLFLLCGIIGGKWLTGLIWNVKKGILLKKAVFSVLMLMICGTAMVSGRQGSCISAARILFSGAGRSYRMEWIERTALLENQETKILIFPRLSRKPPLICQMDLASDIKDPYYFYNEQVAEYYGKELVLCEKGTEE